MSLSRAYPTARVHYEPLDGVSDKEYKTLHWTVQLQLRPLGSRNRWENNKELDYDNRLDNWDDPENYEEIQ